MGDIWSIENARDTIKKAGVDMNDDTKNRSKHERSKEKNNKINSLEKMR